MKIQSILVLVMLMLSLPVFAGQDRARGVLDPMKYAVENSKFFAEGDANDSSGWEHCDFDDSQEDAITRIECSGARSLLVHGGHMVTSRFVCHFSFEPLLHNGRYELAYSVCE